MSVERLEGKAPCFGIEPDALQRPQSVAKRDQMGALRAVRTERASRKQDRPPYVAGIGRRLQGGEDTGRRQISVVRLRCLGGKIPERDRHLFAQRIEHRDEPLQQAARQPGPQRDVDAGT